MIVLAVKELVKIAKVESVDGIFARPPAPTIPYAVDKEEIAELMDENRVAVETYPEVPRPATVEVNLSPRPNPNTVEVIDEVNSVGSIKLLI